MDVLRLHEKVVCFLTFWRITSPTQCPSSPYKQSISVQRTIEDSQGPHSHILMTGGVRQRFIFYTQKNPNFRICLPKKIPPFFSIPKKIPQCFCISKFYYLSSSWKAKTCQLQLWFWQEPITVLVKNKTISCAYVIFDLS